MFVDGDFNHYLSVGLSALKVIQDALASCKTEARAILDLPRGFGRVTRVLRVAYPAAEIYVSDIDVEAVEFSARTFNATALRSQPDFGALNFGRTFDLIWVGSLITHLPAEATSALLGFALRHLSPDGVAFLSSRGAYVAGRLHAATIHQDILSGFFQSGYGFLEYARNDGSIQRYGNSVISRNWLLAAISSLGREVISYRDHGWDCHHDVVAFKKAKARSWSFFPRIRTANSFRP
jgi:hypothetical protein